MQERRRLVRVALGEEPGDLVIRDAMVVSPLTSEFYQADVLIADGRIAAVGTGFKALSEMNARGAYLAPGFIDGHIHIESSLLTPAGFAQAVLPHGTTTVVAEPHEVVNVVGMAGMQWMLEAGQLSGMRIYTSAPSCVPASEFERGGAQIGAIDVASMLTDPQVLGLAEMMNYPGVLSGDQAVWDILTAGAASGKRMDGHAAGLSGRRLQAYVASGMHSDHEATTFEEAQERLRAGLWLMVREGSAARNLEAIIPLLRYAPRRVMLVGDDVSVDELLSLGHLDRLLRLCVAGGIHPARAIGMVTGNPAEYWGLRDLGAIAPGYCADLVLIGSLNEFEILETMVAGQLFQPGKLSPTPDLLAGRVDLGPGWESCDLEPRLGPVMRIYPDQIVTGREPAGTGDARLVVADRYGRDEVASCWTIGSGLTGGTLAMTTLHDAHHAVFLGGTDQDIRLAGRELERLGGGVVVVAGGELRASLALPYAGLMSAQPPQEVASGLDRIVAAARELGCVLPYPVTTVSFLGLTVIPSLKLTPRGLLDVEAWKLC